MPDAVPGTTLPIYPGLGLAPNMLACIPGAKAVILLKIYKFLQNEQIKVQTTDR